MKTTKIEVSEFELSLLLGLVDGERMEYERKAKAEVSEFELSLLLGLVDGERVEYERKAKAIPVYDDYASLARSFKVLHEKLRSAKPVPAESLKT